MKMFTPEEVTEKIKKFNEYLEEERKLQQELLSLNIYGSRDKVSQNLKRHDEIIKQIENIRNNGMLPILKELTEFISVCQKLEKEGKLKPLKSEEGAVNTEK